jgi:O-antigen ligase/Tfp pilus assembly protein PilF
LWSQDLAQLKRRLIALLTLVTLALLLYYLAKRDLSALYALILSFVSLVLIVWTLPHLRLGLSAAFLFVMPLLIYSGNTSYGYTKIIFSLFFISLLLMVWIIEMALRREYRFNLSQLVWPGLAVIGAALLSLVHSPVPLGDSESIVLLVYFFAFALIMANTMESQGDLRLLLHVLLLSAALASFYSLLQYYGLLPGRPGNLSGAGAVISTLGNKNYFAGFIAYLFAPGLFLLSVKTNPNQLIKLLVLLELALLYLGLLAANSASAWVAAGLSIAFLWIGLWIYQRRELAPEQMYRVYTLVALLAVSLLFYVWTTSAWVTPGVSIAAILSSSTAPALGFLLLLLLFPVALAVRSFFLGVPRSWRYGTATILLAILVGLTVSLVRWRNDPILKPIFSKLSSGSLGVRLEEWDVAYLMFRDHPFIGAGIGEYKRQYLAYKARYLQTPQGRALNASLGYNPRPIFTHNEYIQIAAEMGLVGLLVAALLIAMVFWSALRRVAASESPEFKFALLALLGSVIAFLSDSFFSFPFHLPANALVFAFLLGALYSSVLGAKKLEIRLQPTVGLALAGVISAIAISVGVFAYRDLQGDLALNRGRAQFSQGDYQAALPNLERSVALSFSPAESLAWLARTYQTLADATSDPEQRQTLQRKSINAFERSLPNFDVELSYYQLATLYFDQGQYGKADHYLTELLAAGPEPHLQADAQYLQVLLTFRLQQAQRALDLLKALMTEHSDYERAYILLAQYQAQQGQYAQAKQMLTEAQAIVTQKIADANAILHPVETITIPKDTYYQAQADQARLQQEQETINRLLQSLP